MINHHAYYATHRDTALTKEIDCMAALLEQANTTINQLMAALDTVTAERDRARQEITSLIQPTKIDVILLWPVHTTEAQRADQELNNAIDAIETNRSFT